ncbi:MAG: excinuclease ABC subunit UvrC [Candidatus Omnitrophica bacterium]|nr:excinuclease ABC subunit UvrC [Candidatus Omnitrophota bacterium]
MKALERLRDFAARCPELPGVYVIEDRAGTPIYIGKAKSLRARLKTHFAASRPADFKASLMRRDAHRIRLIQTATEAEALLLEASLIKDHHPRYNKELKDDKSYPFLKITAEEFPRMLVTRGRRPDGARYFGPYTSARLLKEAVKFLRVHYPMRTCRSFPGKACLMFHIAQCPAPCEGRVSREEYRKTVRELEGFLAGRTEALVRSLARRMREASAAKAYETAAVLRDQIRALSAVAARPGVSERKDPAAVLEAAQDTLHLRRRPERIEALDISNMAGENPVGSVVVFVGGVPERSGYRKFKIRTVGGIDDYAMMRELVSRRYKRVLDEGAPAPDLILIDGGRGHLTAAEGELGRIGYPPVDLWSIAKEREELFCPGRSRPVVLPPNSEILNLLRHVRDEAHRFAISFYRKLHARKLVLSRLDAIPGVGPQTRRRLWKAFKSIDAIRAADRESLRRLAGISPRTAKNIEEYFKRD